MECDLTKFGLDQLLDAIEMLAGQRLLDNSLDRLYELLLDSDGGTIHLNLPRKKNG